MWASSTSSLAKPEHGLVELVEEAASAGTTPADPERSAALSVARDI